MAFQISQMLQPTNRRDAIYRVSNRCAFSGFWIKLDSRRDKSRLYGSHFLELAVWYIEYFVSG